jgi:hypothetical protein
MPTGTDPSLGRFLRYGRIPTVFLIDFRDLLSALDNSGFQDPATSIMEGMLNLHHDIMYYMILVFIFVSWLMYRTVLLFGWDNNHFWYFYTIDDERYIRSGQTTSNMVHNPD